MNTKITFLVIGVLIFTVSCSHVTMIHSGNGSYHEYKEVLKEKRNILLSFEGYPNYEAWVWSKDILISNGNFLGIPIYRDLNVQIPSGEKILLKDVSQGNKVLYVILIPKVDNRPRTQSKYFTDRKIRRSQGKIVVHIGISANTINITDPEITKVQQVIHIENAVSLKKKEQQQKIQSLENIMDEYDSFRRRD